MTALREKLRELGLSEYQDVFVNEGFDTWEIILDITESDLTSLNVKLGHRRKLQRAIAAWRGQSGEAPLPTIRQKLGTDDEHRSDDGEGDGGKSFRAANAPAQATQKRKYRRHPKPDENAPDRPPSAYVIFSNQVRETLKGQDLSFSDIAKIVGERWQVLPSDARDACDKQATVAKERYYQELSEYKKTPEYAKYQAYLADFKAKHSGVQGGGGKRSRVESETSLPGSTTGSSSASHRSLAMGTSSSHTRTNSSEHFDSMTPTGQYLISASGSPAAPQAFAGATSPQLLEGISPVSTSARSISAFRDPGYTSASYGIPDPRDRLRQDPSPTSMPSAAYFPPATSPPAVSLPPYQNVHDPLIRRRIIHSSADERVPSLQRNDSSIPSIPSVPSLTHTDTVSSNGSETRSRQSSYAGPTIPPPHLLPIDASKSHRILPQPIPTSMTSPVEQSVPGLPTRGAPLNPRGPPSDQRQGWSALVMAADLARNEQNPSPVQDRPP